MLSTTNKVALAASNMAESGPLLDAEQTQKSLTSIVVHRIGRKTTMNNNKSADSGAAIIVAVVLAIIAVVLLGIAALPALAMGGSLLGIGISVALGIFLLSLLIPGVAEEVGGALAFFFILVVPIIGVIGAVVLAWIELL